VPRDSQLSRADAQAVMKSVRHADGEAEGERKEIATTPKQTRTKPWF